MEFLKKHRDFIVYNIFGFMATLLNTGLYALLYETLNLENIPSVFLSWVVTIIFAFFTNKIFVYRSKGWERKRVVAEFLSFISARALSFLFDVIFMYVTVDVLSLEAVIMKLISALGVGLINYLLGKLIFYHKNKSD